MPRLTPDMITPQSRLLTLGLVLTVLAWPSPGAEREPSAVARALIENLNQVCDHQARIPASVRVVGSVTQPGRYEMRTTDTVWMLLERAGANAATAALDQILLIRRDADGNEGRHILNWVKREEYGLEPLLCDGDVVYVSMRVD